MHGSALTAVCRRAHGRGEQSTALNVAHCVGDIGNNNGQLVCNGGQPAAPPPLPQQAQAAPYPGPGYSPPSTYPAPGYVPPPRYGDDRGYWQHCERLRHEARELRNRLAYTPYGQERERLQYQLGRVQAERERCPPR
jgi:hypothetical protein